MPAPDHVYTDETPEWVELMRALDAYQYEYDASGIDRTDQIDLHTPGGRYPTIP